MPKKRKTAPPPPPEDDEVDLSVMHQIIPCREKQINDIYTLMGESWQYTVPSIFIYGHASCGKSLVLENLLRCLEYPHVIINCVESYLVTIIYQEILRGIHEYCSRGCDSEYVLPKKCDNMSDFVRYLREMVDVLSPKETVYIVLSKADRLRDKDPCLLAGFLKLQELTSRNTCVILESQVTWDKFHTNLIGQSPCILHFPSYSKDELLTILCFLRPSGVSNDRYKGFINMLLSVFFTACRDLRELRHLAKLNYPIYCAPIENGIVAESESHKLWKNIEPHLRDALRTVYLGEISSDEWSKQHYKHCDIDEEAGGIIPYVSIEKRNISGNVELPLYSKFFLIAAYLASYNPMKTDIRFFVKITTLVSLQLLSRVGHEDQIDCPKYKCTASLDFVQSISKTVEFEVMQYLFDFI